MAQSPCSVRSPRPSRLPRSLRLLVAACGLGLLALPAPALSADANPPLGVGVADECLEIRMRLRPGMSAAAVRKALGPPQSIARQILFHRYREQWFYERPCRLRLDFECHKGQPPQLRQVLPPRPAG